MRKGGWENMIFIGHTKTNESRKKGRMVKMKKLLRATNYKKLGNASDKKV